ncbi:MAG: copper chaperone PCu(A)C [Anaerolineales bacterium]|nr:MAG: copper chaperone PCu(A)C [Anaerolineales bacterium]
MKKIVMFVLTGMLLLNACAAPGSVSIEVSGTWARSGSKDGNSAAYMLLFNQTGQTDQLIGASSDAASAVEIHLSQMSTDGVMQMTRQEAITLPSNAMLELKPGSYHVMLIDLKQDLAAGESIEITLHFRNHADVILTVPIRDAADMGGSGMDGQNMP